MARFYDPENEGSKSRVCETQKARKYVRLNPDAPFGMAEIDIDEGEDGLCRWYAYVEGDDDAVPSLPEPENVVEPDLGVKVETSEASIPEARLGPDWEYLAGNPEPEPSRRVTVSFELDETALDGLAKMLRGKIGGAVLRICDAEGAVIAAIETTKPGKPGREPRDWTVKPIVTGTNASAQSRLNRIEVARGNLRALRLILDGDERNGIKGISKESNQTYTIQARRYCEALIAEAEGEEALYGPSDHLLAAD